MQDLKCIWDLRFRAQICIPILHVWSASQLARRWALAFVQPGTASLHRFTWAECLCLS